MEKIEAKKTTNKEDGLEYIFFYKKLKFILQVFDENDYNLSLIDQKISNEVILTNGIKEVLISEYSPFNYYDTKRNITLSLHNDSEYILKSISFNKKTSSSEEDELYIKNDEVYYKTKKVKNFSELTNGYIKINEKNLLLYQLEFDENLRNDKNLILFTNLVRNLNKKDKKNYEILDQLSEDNILQENFKVDKKLFKLLNFMIEINQNFISENKIKKKIKKGIKC